MTISRLSAGSRTYRGGRAKAPEPTAIGSAAHGPLPNQRGHFFVPCTRATKGTVVSRTSRSGRPTCAPLLKRFCAGLRSSEASAEAAPHRPAVPEPSPAEGPDPRAIPAVADFPTTPLTVASLLLELRGGQKFCLAWAMRQSTKRHRVPRGTEPKFYRHLNWDEFYLDMGSM